MQLIGGADPLAANSLAFRRVAAIEFLGQAIFTDRKHGKRVAARVLAETPMPEAAAIGAYGGPEKAVAGSKATILKRRDRLNWE
jgi:hypothetical protein